MSLPLLVVVLSLASGLDSPTPAPATSAARLAQDDRLEEEFGDPPPPPPPLEGEEADAPLDLVGDAPALPPPVVEDTPDAPADDDERERGAAGDDEDDDGEGGSVLLTRTLQYGAGFGTAALCTAVGAGLSCCGLACLTSAFQPLVFSLPLLVPCGSALLWTVFGGAGGAAAGAVEVLVGNAFGDEEAELLWPTLAAAGTGAGLLALSGGATLLSQVVQPSFVAPQPGNLQFNTPLTCLLSSASIVLCGSFCVVAPLVGVLTYGSTAIPKGPAPADAAVHSAPQGPTLAAATSAMAF